MQVLTGHFDNFSTVTGTPGRFHELPGRFRKPRTILNRTRDLRSSYARYESFFRYSS